MTGEIGISLGLRQLDSAGGGSVPYAASAVHFDGLSWLLNDALATTDNAFFSFSFWMKLQTVDDTTDPFVCDPDGQSSPFMYFNAGFVSNFYAGIPPNFMSLSDQDGPYLDYTIWHHFLGAMDGQNQIIKVYIDDVPYGDLGVNGTPFDFNMNGKPFSVGGNTFGEEVIGDLADAWFAPGVNLLTGGNIVESTRRKFISSTLKPVDLGMDGSTPTGAAPTIFFSGDATAFSTNQGTGGTFTLTGSLTNASTSPSD